MTGPTRRDDRKTCQAGRKKCSFTVYAAEAFALCLHSEECVCLE